MFPNLWGCIKIHNLFWEPTQIYKIYEHQRQSIKISQTNRLPLIFFDFVLVSGFQRFALALWLQMLLACCCFLGGGTNNESVAVGVLFSLEVGQTMNTSQLLFKSLRICGTLRKSLKIQRNPVKSWEIDKNHKIFENNK